MSMILPSAASDLALLAAAAREAGVIARASFGKSVKTWSKGAAGPVTEVDIAIDVLLREGLGAARPDYGWLSEETADTAARLSHERIFIVDPIDGTRAYIAGKPEFTISIGVCANQSAFAGLVYNPISDEMFLGGEGVGATLNGAPIQVTDHAQLENASLVGNKGYFGASRWSEPWPPMRFTWRDSTANRLALVSAGRFDAVVLPGQRNEWDIAGGAAIAAAAGGRVTDLAGAPLRFNQPTPSAPGVVAAGGALHALLIERMRAAEIQPKQDAAS